MGGRVSLLFAFLIVVLVFQAVPPVTGSYVEHILLVPYFTYSNVNLTVLEAKGLSATYTSSGGVPASIYSSYYTYDNSTGYNDTLILMVNSTLDLVNFFNIYSTSYSEIKPREIDVSSTNDYVAYVGTATKASGGDEDGYIFITDTQLTQSYYDVFDGISSTENDTMFSNVFYSSNNYIFVTGAVYDSSAGQYKGLIAIYGFNGTEVSLKTYNTYTYSDPDGYSNNLFFMDSVIGPDGYLYVTGYIPYFYSGNAYDYKGAVVKIDPQSLSVVSAIIVHLYNSQGTVKPASWTGNIASDNQYLYVSFNKASENMDSSGIYSYAAHVMCLDTSLNTVWSETWDTSNYNELFFDILVTGENVTLVGGTDDDFGDTNFSQMNDVMLSLDPASGSPNYAVMVGGSGYEYFKDPAIDNNGKLYAIGDTDSSSFYELYIPPSALNITHETLGSEPGNGVGVGSLHLKPSETQPVKSILLEDMTRTTASRINGSSSPTGGAPGIHAGRPGFKAVTRHTGLSVSKGVVQRQLHGLQVEGTPGHIVKFYPDAGTVTPAPQPIPEEIFLVIAGVTAAAASILLVYRRRILF